MRACTYVNMFLYDYKFLFWFERKHMCYVPSMLLQVEYTKYVCVCMLEAILFFEIFLFNIFCIEKLLSARTPLLKSKYYIYREGKWKNTTRSLTRHSLRGNCCSLH